MSPRLALTRSMIGCIACRAAASRPGLACSILRISAPYSFLTVLRCLSSCSVKADRTPEICQSQSVNVFLPGDIDKWDLHMLHWTAWERGCKSLYYLRSKSVQRAAFAGNEIREKVDIEAAAKTDYEECLACQ